MNEILEEIDRYAEMTRDPLARNNDLVADYHRRLDISWIYHDHALEGVVITFPELNAAINDRIISDITLIPTYEEVINHRDAIILARATVLKKRVSVNLELMKKWHTILSTEHSPRSGKAPPKPPPGQYRKDNPLHRLYFHEIAPPEKIQYQMRKFTEWMGSDEAKKMHPVKRAAFAHHKLITIFPWPRYSGKIARLLMNTMLLRDGYLPTVIHAIERQHYYESLRQSPEELTLLICEYLLKTYRSTIDFFHGANQQAVAMAS